MDVKIEAAAMAADALVLNAVVKAVKHFLTQAYALIERVASISCPSIGGHSLSAVTPDHINLGGTTV